MGEFDAVLFDAGDTLIRLSGSGERLLHRAAASLGVDRLDPAETAGVWRRVLDRSGTAEELAKGRDLSNARHRKVWVELYQTAGCERLVPGLSEALYELTVCAESWEAFPDTLPTLTAVRDRGLRVGIVDQLAASAVHQAHAFLHLFQRLGVDHVLRLRSQTDVQ